MDMKKLLNCRVCLAENARMSFLGKNLQNLYEALTSRPTNDRRPIQVCYICCARLQNCYQLKMSCLQSEEFLTQMLSNNMVKPVTFSSYGSSYKLEIVHPMIELSVDDAFDTGTIVEVGTVVPEVTDKIKHECEDFEAVMIDSQEQTDGTEVEDYLSMEISKEELSDAEKTQTDGTDVEDYLSMEISKEELNEAEKNILPPEEPAPTVQRKSEDSTACKFVNMEETKSLVTSKCGSELTLSKRKSYLCDICSKSFSRKHDLIVHFRNTGKKPYQSNVCKKTFVSKFILDKHIKTQKCQKRYQCDICQKGFQFKKAEFNRHYRQHTGEKPYQCNICKKYFSRKGNLKTHIKIHTAKKPYQCDICKKGFSGQGKLKAHLKYHPDKQQCDKCNKFLLVPVGHLWTGFVTPCSCENPPPIIQFKLGYVQGLATAQPGPSKAVKLKTTNFESRS